MRTSGVTRVGDAELKIDGLSVHVFPVARTSSGDSLAEAPLLQALPTATASNG